MKIAKAAPLFRNQAGVDTNAVATKVAIPPGATAPQTGDSNSLIVVGQKINPSKPPSEFSNLVWPPAPSFRMGLEYLFGTKETQNDAEHDEHRLDFVFRYDLVR